MTNKGRFGFGLTLLILVGAAVVITALAM